MRDESETFAHFEETVPPGVGLPLEFEGFDVVPVAQLVDGLVEFVDQVLLFAREVAILAFTLLQQLLPALLRGIKLPLQLLKFELAVEQSGLVLMLDDLHLLVLGVQEVPELLQLEFQLLQLAFEVVQVLVLEQKGLVLILLQEALVFLLLSQFVQQSMLSLHQLVPLLLMFVL